MRATMAVKLLSPCVMRRRHAWPRDRTHRHHVDTVSRCVPSPGGTPSRSSPARGVTRAAEGFYGRHKDGADGIAMWCHSWQGTRATEDVSVRPQWQCVSDARRLVRPRGLARGEARQCVRVVVERMRTYVTADLIRWSRL